MRDDKLILGYPIQAWSTNTGRIMRPIFQYEVDIEFRDNSILLKIDYFQAEKLCHSPTSPKSI